MNKYPETWPRGFHLVFDPTFQNTEGNARVLGIQGVDGEGRIFSDTTDPNLIPLFRATYVGGDILTSILTDGEYMWGIRSAICAFTSYDPGIAFARYLSSEPPKLWYWKDDIALAIKNYLNE